MRMVMIPVSYYDGKDISAQQVLDGLNDGDSDIFKHWNDRLQGVLVAGTAKIVNNDITMDAKILLNGRPL